jgi:hypothetical protein
VRKLEEMDFIGSGSIVTLQDRVEGRPDRRSLLFAGVLLLAGTAVYWVAQQFHEERGVTPNEVFTAYANSTSWVFVHAVQFAGSAIVIFGL